MVEEFDRFPTLLYHAGWSILAAKIRGWGLWPASSRCWPPCSLWPACHPPPAPPRRAGEPSPARARSPVRLVRKPDCCQGEPARLALAARAGPGPPGRAQAAARRAPARPRRTIPDLESKTAELGPPCAGSRPLPAHADGAGAPRASPGPGRGEADLGRLSSPRRSPRCTSTWPRSARRPARAAGAAARRGRGALFPRAASRPRPVPPAGPRRARERPPGQPHGRCHRALGALGRPGVLGRRRARRDAGAAPAQAIGEHYLRLQRSGSSLAGHHRAEQRRRAAPGQAAADRQSPRRQRAWPRPSSCSSAPTASTWP